MAQEEYTQNSVEQQKDITIRELQEANRKMQEELADIKRLFGEQSKEAISTEEIKALVEATTLLVQREAEREYNKVSKKIERLSNKIKQDISNKFQETMTLCRNTATKIKNTVNQFAQDRKQDVIRACNKAKKGLLTIQKDFYKGLNKIEKAFEASLDKQELNDMDKAIADAEAKMYKEMAKETKRNFWRKEDNKIDINSLQAQALERINQMKADRDTLKENIEESQKQQTEYEVKIDDLDRQIDDLDIKINNTQYQSFNSQLQEASVGDMSVDRYQSMDLSKDDNILDDTREELSVTEKDDKGAVVRNDDFVL